MEFGGGGVGANDGEEGRVIDCGAIMSETIGTAKSATACSGVEAGSVGSSAVAVPAMLGHQHGACDPVPSCIDAGIAS